MSKHKRHKPDVIAQALARLQGFVKERGDLTRASEKIGVGLPTIYRWVRNKSKPHAVYARLILEKLA